MSEKQILGEIVLDSKQKLIARKLEQLALKLQEKEAVGFFKKIFGGKSHLKSFYIYGDVGRGKSMLMKNFFHALLTHQKIYLHFNKFMQQVHEALRDVRRDEKKFKDELIEAVRRVVKSNHVICFDEFQVLDIADAMLLSRIFSYLFSRGVVVVFTSNSPPLELYKNGLQREVFLEFVREVLLKNCEILYLDSVTDYRMEFRKGLARRYFISNQKNREAVKEIIKNFTDGEKLRPKKLLVWGREIELKKTFKKVAVIDFNELCRVEFSAADYREICRNFDLIFLHKLSRLGKEDANEARRFVLFIDEVYEQKVALIVVARCKSEEVYTEGTGAEAFKRTVSRLNEIKSDEYWEASKAMSASL